MGVQSERWGSLNTITGITTSEAIQARTDARTASIRREAQYVPVMSDEEWNRRQKEAREKAEYQLKKEKEEREKIEKDYARQVLRRAASEESNARVQRDKQFPAEVEKKLRTYHELPDESIPEKEWYPIYTETAPFLAKCVVVYRYGNDKLKGRTEGDLGDFWGHNLVEYLSQRDIAADEDEGGFENLVSQKLSFAQFLTVALIDNIDAIAEDSTKVMRKNLLEFIISDEVTQIELEELVSEK